MIKFDKVSKYFGLSEQAALANVSFSVQPGEFVFVTGHSGCGKTTLLRLLLRELRPDEGSIYFQDQELNHLSARRVAKHRRRLGVVFQDYQLINDLNVYENIALPLIIAKQDKSEIKQRISELLKILGLEGYEKAFPNQLSGGQAQRISFARALAIAPQVIFADEPTGNLDQAASLDILHLLQSVNRYGTTVIFATHNLSLLDHSLRHRQLQLERGQLIADVYHDQSPITSIMSEPNDQAESPLTPDQATAADADSKSTDSDAPTAHDPSPSDRPEHSTARATKRKKRQERTS